MELTPGLQLPAAFVPYWPDIEKTKLPAVQIKATPSTNLALQQSKFPHYPSMPLDFDYPKDEHGKYLLPLAQINFSEVPKLPGYPESGYLQFYISPVDDSQKKY